MKNWQARPAAAMQYVYGVADLLNIFLASFFSECLSLWLCFCCLCLYTLYCKHRFMVCISFHLSLQHILLFLCCCPSIAKCLWDWIFRHLSFVATPLYETFHQKYFFPMKAFLSVAIFFCGMHLQASFPH